MNSRIPAICSIEVPFSIHYYNTVNSNLIRERLNRDTEPFVFRLSDGTRVPVAHPDFVAVSPGQVVVIDAKTEGVTRIDPLHVVAIEDGKKRKTNGKHNKNSKDNILDAVVTQARKGTKPLAILQALRKAGYKAAGSMHTRYIVAREIRRVLKGNTNKIKSLFPKGVSGFLKAA